MVAKNISGMFVENGVLFDRDEVCGYPVSQLCVPHGRRMQVCRCYTWLMIWLLRAI